MFRKQNVVELDVKVHELRTVSVLASVHVLECARQLHHEAGILVGRNLLFVDGVVEIAAGEVLEHQHLYLARIDKRVEKSHNVGVVQPLCDRHLVEVIILNHAWEAVPWQP